MVNCKKRKNMTGTVDNAVEEIKNFFQSHTARKRSAETLYISSQINLSGGDPCLSGTDHRPGNITRYRQKQPGTGIFQRRTRILSLSSPKSDRNLCPGKENRTTPLCPASV